MLLSLNVLSTQRYRVYEVMDKLNTVKNKNRRIAFRIYDDVKLSYHLVDEALVNETIAKFSNKIDGLQLLPTIEIGRQPLNVVLAERNTQNVNLSATGMAFTCEDQLVAGDYLRIKMLLLSNMDTVEAYCRVVYCRNSNPYENDYPFLVGMHFVAISEADYQVLVTQLARKKMQQMVMNGFIFSFLLALLVVPGLVFKMLFKVCHFCVGFVLHMLHLVFEIFEYNLDHVIEHLFHTELHNTQVIVFYTIMSMLAYGGYRILRVLPGFLRRTKTKLMAYALRKKASFLYFWREQSWTNKVRMIALGTAAISLYVSFTM